MGDLLRLPLETPGDVAVSRQLTLDVAREAGMASLQQTKLATVVEGLARRCLAGGSAGEVVFSVEGASGDLRLVVAVPDAFTGTEAGGMVSPAARTGRAAFGLDLHSLRRLVDDLERVAEADGRRRVKAAVRLSAEVATDPGLLPRLRALRPVPTAWKPSRDKVKSIDVTALMEAQSKQLERTTAELERTTAELERVNRERVAVNAELALTNRGVLDLVAELSDANEALAAGQENQELARRILESAGEAYVRFSADGLVTEWNVQAEKTFGWHRAEAIGQPLVSLVIGPGERESLERLLGLPGGSDEAGTPAEHFEHTMLHRSGHEFPAEVTAWTTTVGAKRVFSCTIRDISERHAVERAKNEFVSVVGHELRTPLTSIHGALGLLRAGLLGELNPRGKQMVDIAVHNTYRLVRLINDVLDIERLNSGNVALELQATDVAALAERSLEVMRSLADGAGVRLKLDARPAVHLVDPDRIEQTITNLLSNAIKFSPAGTEVRLMVRSDSGGLTIQVRDQGRGIPAEDLERIFDRFQQVDSSDAREKGGTGLGLAICRTIAEQHGGRIWAESSPGDGATLTLTLSDADAAGLEVRAEAPSGPKIVVCSDDASVRALIAEMLLPHGYIPIEVNTSSELFDACLQHRPSVILLEQRTPTVANWEAAVGLRDHPETRDIPVVFLSFDGDKIVAESDELRSVEERVDMGGLLAAVGEAIGQRDTGPKLLLVEDDEGLAAVMTEGFRQLGIEVHNAPTARQALALCAHIVPDLVVLDLQLPDQDGFAVVAQLRRDERLRSVPLAVYSARDLNEADRKRLRLGETWFFTKGRVSPDEFERNVVNLLGPPDNAKVVSRG